jgi:hypothetical protein
MSDRNLDSLIDQFITASTSHYSASLVGNWRIVNKEVSKIKKIVDHIRSFGADGQNALLVQLENQNPSVAAMAAIYSLKYNTEKSITALQKITTEPGLLGFEAEQALLRWKEGEWNLESDKYG